MSAISAKASVFKQLVTSDGTDTEVPFVRHGIARTLIDVRQAIFLTVEVRPGAAGCDFTVNGYQDRDLGGVVTALYAKTTNAADALILDAADIKAVNFVEVLEDGTDTQDQMVIVTAK